MFPFKLASIYGQFRNIFPPRRIALWLLAISAGLGLCAWRLYQARGLVLPVWVDPVHHVLLVRKMVEYGGLPPDWLPYLPVPMYYHYGFHILAAAFSFWSRFSPEQSVLWFGQVLNALVTFSVYRLARSAWAEEPRAVLRAGLAALLTTFGFQMPGYYLSWGRYPLLAGLVVLPLAMAAALEVRRAPAERAAWARLALYTAATCFCHFLVVGLLGLFFLVLLGAEFIRWRSHAQTPKTSSRSFIRGLQSAISSLLRGTRWQPFAAAALGGLAASPWLVRVWGYTRQMLAVKLPDPLNTTVISNDWNLIIPLIGPLRGYILLALAGLGLLVLLVRGRGVRWLAAWSLLLVLLATPYSPRFDPFRPDLVAIVLFLPASLLLADLLVEVGEFGHFLTEWGAKISSSPPHQRRYGKVLALLPGLTLVAWGLWETRDIVNPVTILAQPADLAALRWIEQNTPSDARFFVNGTPWMGNQQRGVDGGFWIPPLTGRFAVIPPVAYGWGAREDVIRFTGWAKRASGVNACDDTFWALVHDAQLNYVYLHSDVGNLKPAALEGCGGVQKVFNQDGVLVYHLER